MASQSLCNDPPQLGSKRCTPSVQLTVDLLSQQPSRNRPKRSVCDRRANDNAPASQNSQTLVRGWRARGMSVRSSTRRFPGSYCADCPGFSTSIIALQVLIQASDRIATLGRTLGIKPLTTARLLPRQPIATTELQHGVRPQEVYSPI
jgi:hypothetical protein